MMPQEAHWFQAWIERQPASALSPMLNVGSSTAHFRTIEQPWIEQALFGPIAAKGVRVIHLDQKRAEGVDLVGDLTDSHCQAGLARWGLRSLLCSNLLEHVAERDALCGAMAAALPPGGLLLLSCPYDFPYHPDPIDSGFRPTPEELATLFPGFELLQGQIVDGHTFWQQINRGPLALAKLALRMLLPFYKPRMWWSILCHLPWLRRPFRASCAVLRKPMAPAP